MLDSQTYLLGGKLDVPIVNEHCNASGVEHTWNDHPSRTCTPASPFHSSSIGTQTRNPDYMRWVRPSDASVALDVVPS